MLASSVRWTADMVRALPDDGRRHEVVDGEYFVNPAPRPVHQFVVMQLFRAVDPYVTAQGLGVLGILDSDLSPDPYTLVQPDLWVAPSDSPRQIRRWDQITRLLLAVEVLSPSSLRADREVKRARYQRWGIPDYWVVDADLHVVDVWTPKDERPRREERLLEWHPEGVTEPLIIDLPKLFQDALGE